MKTYLIYEWFMSDGDEGYWYLKPEQEEFLQYLKRNGFLSDKLTFYYSGNMEDDEV